MVWVSEKLSDRDCELDMDNESEVDSLGLVVSVEDKVSVSPDKLDDGVGVSGGVIVAVNVMESDVVRLIVLRLMDGLMLRDSEKVPTVAVSENVCEMLNVEVDDAVDVAEMVLVVVMDSEAMDPDMDVEKEMVRLVDNDAVLEMVRLDELEALEVSETVKVDVGDGVSGGVIVVVAVALIVGDVDGVADSESVALAVGEGVSAGVMVAVRLKDVDRDVVKLRVRLTVGEVVGVAAGVIVGLLDEDEVWAVVGDEDGVSMQVGVVVPVEVLLLLNAASALVGTATTTTRKRICAVTRVRRRESVEMTSPLHFILFEGPDEVII